MNILPTFFNRSWVDLYSYKGSLHQILNKTKNKKKTPKTQHLGPCVFSLFQTLGKTPRLGQSTCLLLQICQSGWILLKKNQTSEQMGHHKSTAASPKCVLGRGQQAACFFNVFIAPRPLAAIIPSFQFQPLWPSWKKVPYLPLSVPYLPCNMDSTPNTPLNMFR